MSYELLQAETGQPVKAWVKDVSFDDETRRQLLQTAQLPFIFAHVAAMPDCHMGKGSTVGSVIPTRGAVIPAAVGVDIGCGMIAVRTNLTANDLPEDLHALRSAIERVVPVGFATWGDAPFRVSAAEAYSRQSLLAWQELEKGYQAIVAQHPKIANDRTSPRQHVGTLGGGNHFIEICLDEQDRVWIMLHSGSRNIGNRIGQYFIELARKDMQAQGLDLPNRDLAYLKQGSRYFDDYVQAVSWAQNYALHNRDVMMANVLQVLNALDSLPPVRKESEAVNCHHNYITLEFHFGSEVWVTRKGAIRAQSGDLGIIPGSMGARSFIVRGKGHPESFMSCSHGAGRKMSRTQAKKVFTLEDHQAATQHVECRKDAGVLDETPGAYKDIDAVMAAQSDLVEVVHTLRQVVCVKG